MDRRERFSSLTLLLKSAMEGNQSNIWTALPGTYQGAGTKVGTANVQPTIQVQLIDPVKNTWQSAQNLPLCLDCPISWPGGGGAHLTFPIAVGDEGLLVFASRCIDNWWLSGGTQPQAEYRMHDLSDGFFIPGCFSQPRAPSAPWSGATVRLTTDDGLGYLEMDPVAHSLNLVFPGGIMINGVAATVPGAGVLRFSGAIEATGGITAGHGGADQVGLQTHTHVYTQPASGTPNQTVPPTAGT